MLANFSRSRFLRVRQCGFFLLTKEAREEGGGQGGGRMKNTAQSDAQVFYRNCTKRWPLGYFRVHPDMASSLFASIHLEINMYSLSFPYDRSKRRTISESIASTSGRDRRACKDIRGITTVHPRLTTRERDETRGNYAATCAPTLVGSWFGAPIIHARILERVSGNPASTYNREIAWLDVEGSRTIGPLICRCTDFNVLVTVTENGAITDSD